MGSSDKRIADIRRDNLRRLIKERFEGNTAALSRATDRAAPIYHGILASPPSKGFGEQLARDIETELDLPRGWLDASDPIPKDPDLSVAEDLFLLAVKKGLREKVVPAHVMQTVLTIIDLLPAK